MNRRRQQMVLALGVASGVATSLVGGGCDEEYAPCPEVDPVRNGEFRLFSEAGGLVDADLTSARVTIDDHGLEIRYQRVDEDQPWVVSYRATSQFPDPTDTD